MSKLIPNNSVPILIIIQVSVAIMSADEKKPLMEAVVEIEADQFKEHIDYQAMPTLSMFNLSKKSIEPMLTLPMSKLSPMSKVFLWINWVVPRHKASDCSGKSNIEKTSHNNVK